MSNANDKNEVLEAKSSGRGDHYVDYHIPASTLKIWMANAKTPEQRKIFASMMPKPKRKYGGRSS